MDLMLYRQERLPAVLVLMPEGPLLRSFYPAKPYEVLRARLASLAHAHDLPFMDARHWLAEEEFTDSYHPNCLGARVVTERLGRQVILPLLRTEQRPRKE